jgi:pimeloyl-ACP methyl ester carboxylesterase
MAGWPSPGLKWLHHHRAPAIEEEHFDERMTRRSNNRPGLYKWLLLAAALNCATGRAQRFSDLAVPTPIPPGSTLVVGFLGGYERWDDEHRSVRRLVLKLRSRRGVFAESISNHNQRVALKLIRRALDTNHDGRLDETERANARIILFGQSWGGGATLNIARELNRLGIPVLLTVQVDSVGLHDKVVPPNVRAAVNFYQRDPLTIEGQGEIRAADSSKTAILGNFEETYRNRPIDPSNAKNSSWARTTLGGSHAKMELDPAIWASVEQYINEAISRR